MAALNFSQQSCSKESEMVGMFLRLLMTSFLGVEPLDESPPDLRIMGDFLGSELEARGLASGRREEEEGESFLTTMVWAV